MTIINRFYFLIFTILFASSCTAQKKNKVKKNSTVVSQNEATTSTKPDTKIGAKLPTFGVLKADLNLTFDTYLDKNKSLVLVLFNPSCGHCEQLINHVRDSSFMFKNVEFLFITGKELLEYVPAFAERLKVKNHELITISSDQSELTQKLFEYNGIPQIMIYNKEKLLQKILFKEATMQQLLDALQPTIIELKK